MVPVSRHVGAKIVSRMAGDATRSGRGGDNIGEGVKNVLTVLGRSIEAHIGSGRGFVNVGGYYHGPAC